MIFVGECGACRRELFRRFLDALAVRFVAFRIRAALTLRHVFCRRPEGNRVDDLVDLARQIAVALFAFFRAGRRCRGSNASCGNDGGFIEREIDIVTCRDPCAFRENHRLIAHRRQRELHRRLGRTRRQTVRADEDADMVEIVAFGIRQKVHLRHLVKQKALLNEQRFDAQEKQAQRIGSCEFPLQEAFDRRQDVDFHFLRIGVNEGQFRQVINFHFASPPKISCADAHLHDRRQPPAFRAFKFDGFDDRPRLIAAHGAKYLAAQPCFGKIDGAVDDRAVNAEIAIHRHGKLHRRKERADVLNDLLDDGSGCEVYFCPSAPLDQIDHVSRLLSCRSHLPTSCRTCFPDSFPRPRCCRCIP